MYHLDFIHDTWASSSKNEQYFQKVFSKSIFCLLSVFSVFSNADSKLYTIEISDDIRD